MHEHTRNLERIGANGSSTATVVVDSRYTTMGDYARGLRKCADVDYYTHAQEMIARIQQLRDATIRNETLPFQRSSVPSTLSGPRRVSSTQVTRVPSKYDIPSDTVSVRRGRNTSAVSDVAPAPGQRAKSSLAPEDKWRENRPVSDLVSDYDYASEYKDAYDLRSTQPSTSDPRLRTPSVGGDQYNVYGNPNDLNSADFPYYGSYDTTRSSGQPQLTRSRELYPGSNVYVGSSSALVGDSSVTDWLHKNDIDVVVTAARKDTAAPDDFSAVDVLFYRAGVPSATGKDSDHLSLENTRILSAADFADAIRSGEETQKHTDALEFILDATTSIQSTVKPMGIGQAADTDRKVYIQHNDKVPVLPTIAIATLAASYLDTSKRFQGDEVDAAIDRALTDYFEDDEDHNGRVLPAASVMTREDYETMDDGMWRHTLVDAVQELAVVKELSDQIRLDLDGSADPGDGPDKPKGRDPVEDSDDDDAVEENDSDDDAVEGVVEVTVDE